MLYQIYTFFLIFSITALTCGEPNLPAPNKLCPTCVKYTGSIEMTDLSNNFNFVMLNQGIFPDHSVVYQRFKSTPGIRAFYYIQDPLKPVPEPLIDLDLCSMHDLSNGLESFYQLTTILASYILPVGLPCKEAMGKRPMPLKVSRTSYYLLREPTPCNTFNITVEIATLQAKLNPYVTMNFTVTKPGKKCKLSLPKLPTTPTEPTKPKSPKPAQPAKPSMG